MALRYAVATGNWSSTSTWNGGTLPTSSDDVYSNGFTVTIDQNISVLSLRNRAGAPAVAGGGFVIASAVTVTVTGTTTGVIGGTGSCITFSGAAGVTATVNTTRLEGPDANSSQTISHTGNGTLNLSCSTTYAAAGSATNRYVVLFTSVSGVLNYSGVALTGNFATASFVINGTGTVNIVAAVTGGSNVAAIDIISVATVNITGDLYGGSNSGRAISISAACVLNITGAVKSSTQGSALLIGAAATITITGAVSNETASATPAINAQTSAAYIKIIGTITASTGIYAVFSNNVNAINIFTGPFISSATGIMPFMVYRMHYQVTTLSYIEFRDSSTNGALPPAANAPATRMVSPDTVVDAPIPANVRFGVSYALGTFTGTLRVPSPDSVAKDVPTDNTVGTAVLKPQDVWNHLVSNIATSGSIGERLKNAATVETTGAQITALNG